MPRQIGDVILEVEDLHTYCFGRFGTVKAVDGVSFTLRQGESLAIVGESGCGKSMTALSLLKLIPKPAARIIKGSIKLEGEDLVPKSEEEMREIRGRRISMILQDPQTSLNPVFTIGNQLIEAIEIHHKDQKQGLIQRAIRGLKQVRVAAPERRVEDYPHQISGGMKQRVVGAIAISCEPKIIIADEPTTSLDVTIQAQYLRLLRELQEETNLSLIFITHDFGVVAKMADRVMVMYAGRAVETGPVREIFNNPKHPYTQALLRSVPRMEEDVERLYSITGQPPALWDLPEGCRFAPRCEFAMERCRSEYPRSFAVEGDSREHVASCWLLEGAPVNRAKPSDLSHAGGEPDAVAMDREANGTARRVGGAFG
jgi:oligopeptide/dipeptide ABC transporter ATP-binding protein